MDYLKLGITPINEQNRAGEDVKYDEDFEKIESEISKLTSPSASNEIDWELVARLCENILQTKSKNLLVGVYLCYALFKVRGIDGLSDAITVLADLLENYWDVMYPPLRRIKGRINAIEWMLDKVSKEFENTQEIQTDTQKKDGFLTNLKRIDDFLNEQLEDAPLFYNLIKLADMKLVTSSAEIKQEEVQKEQIRQPEVQKEEIEQKVVEVKQSLSGDVEKDFKGVVSNLNLLVGQMIEAKDYRSELFVINRSFAWLDIDELPSSDKNITMLPPPDTQEMEILQKLYEEKEYEALLWAAESRITTYLFWLDLHFYVAQSLKNLGKNQAAQSVWQQTLYFVNKLPKLQNLSFSDSTPFAAKMTKKWLEVIEKKDNNVLKTTKKDIKTDLKCDSKGVDELCELIKSATSIEEEVLYNIEICRCLAENVNETLIKAYTKQLLDKIEQYKTYRWKPEIALDAYLVSVECLDNVGGNDELLEELRDKIALLKPSLIDS